MKKVEPVAEKVTVEVTEESRVREITDDNGRVREATDHNDRVETDAMSDSSSLLDDSDDLLSELIQSAMPKGKNVSRRLDMDRAAEGSESVDVERTPSKPMTAVQPLQRGAFQPQRTSSHINSNKTSTTDPSSGDLDTRSGDLDTLRTYSAEDTPFDYSAVVSQGNVTTRGQRSVNSTADNSNSIMNSLGLSANDSVFVPNQDSVDTPKVYDVEGTPQNFSCNDSLSSLSIMSEDIKTDYSHLKMACGLGRAPDSNRAPVLTSVTSGLENMQREVEGQSSDEMKSVPNKTGGNKGNDDQSKTYAVEDTPMSFSRRSSLSSIHSEGKEKVCKKSSLYSIPDIEVVTRIHTSG